MMTVVEVAVCCDDTDGGDNIGSLSKTLILFSILCNHFHYSTMCWCKGIQHKFSPMTLLRLPGYSDKNSRF